MQKADPVLYSDRQHVVEVALLHFESHGYFHEYVENESENIG
jgi:hypothetical protein